MSRRKVVENHAEAHRPVIDQKADKERSAEPSDEHTFCESEDALLASKRICKPLPDSQPVTLDDWHRALGFHKCATWSGKQLDDGIGDTFVSVMNRSCAHTLAFGPSQINVLAEFDWRISDL